MADYAYDDTGYVSMAQTGTARRPVPVRPADAEPGRGFAAVAARPSAFDAQQGAPARGARLGQNVPYDRSAPPYREEQHDHDTQDDRAEPAGGNAPGFQQMANIIGALLSVLLVVGLAVWGYRLAMRDVAGVPVVRALEGPMRIAPQDPGGDQADYQGLAVNSVAATGAAAPAADRLVLAPRPIDVDGTDLPVPVMPEPVQTTAAAAMPAVAEPLVEGVFSDVLPGTSDSAAPVENQQPLTPAVGLAAQAQPAAVEQAVAMAVALQAPGVKTSPRPPARPQTRAAAAAVVVAAPAPAAPQEVAADSIGAGTRLVQLGAFDTVEAARADWDRLSAIYADVFSGKARVVQQAVSGGQTFYRLRVQGFSDDAAANAFCSVLLFGNTENCIPVLVR